MQTVRTSLPIIQRIRMLATTPRLDAGEKWRLRLLITPILLTCLYEHHNMIVN